MSYEALRVTAGGQGRLRVAGELDGATAQKFEKAITGAMRTGRDVFVDMSEVTFMDSTGLRAVIGCLAMLGRSHLVITSSPKHVRKVFETAGVIGSPGLVLSP